MTVFEFPHSNLYTETFLPLLVAPPLGLRGLPGITDATGLQYLGDSLKTSATILSGLEMAGYFSSFCILKMMGVFFFKVGRFFEVIYFSIFLMIQLQS